MMMLVRVCVLVSMLVAMRVFVGVNMSVLVLMFMALAMMMIVPVLVVVMAMFMFVVMTMPMRMIVIVIMRQVHIKFYALDAGLLLPREMQVVAIQLELLEFVFEFVRVHAQINQRADKHVTAYAAENVEVKC